MNMEDNKVLALYIIGYSFTMGVLIALKDGPATWKEFLIGSGLSAIWPITLGIIVGIIIKSKGIFP